MPFEQPVIARAKVRYVGEPVAVVLADSAALAEDALDAIALDIEPLPGGDRLRRGGGRQGPAVRGARHQSRRWSSSRAEGRCGGGVPGRALYAGASGSSVQRHTAVTMEPRGVLAEWDGARGS